jgi:lysozyme
MTGAEFAANCIIYKGVREGTQAHKSIVDVYNQIKPLPRGYKAKYTDAWCAIFVSAMAFRFGVTDKISCECSAHYMYEAMMSKKVQKDKGQIGDIIFYDFNGDGWCDHVGIILDKQGRDYSVLEGNKSDAVGIRTIKYSNANVYAVCHPNWDNQVDTSGNLKDVDTIAVEVIQGKWGNMPDRKKRLKAAGYDYDAVQKVVNTMLKK